MSETELRSYFRHLASVPAWNRDSQWVDNVCDRLTLCHVRHMPTTLGWCTGEHIHLTVWPGETLAQVTEVILHELTHAADLHYGLPSLSKGHGFRFHGRMTYVAQAIFPGSPLLTANFDLARWLTLAPGYGAFSLAWQNVPYNLPFSRP